jgi:hypothetical protein
VLDHADPSTITAGSRTTTSQWFITTNSLLPLMDRPPEN